VEAKKEESEGSDDDKALVFLTKLPCNMFNKKLDAAVKKNCSTEA
jgi:hypothetical protein